MKQGIFHIFFFCLLPLAVCTQPLAETFPALSGETRHLLRLHGSAYYDSQEISNELAAKFFRGGYIDTTLKNNVYRNLKNENPLGAEVNNSLHYYNFTSSFFGKPHWGWMFGLGNHEYYHSVFSKNMFGLVLTGNKQFAGDTVSLAPFEYNQLRFQKLQFGIFNKDNFSQISFSLIKAENLFEMKLNRADLYTEANGKEIALSLHESMIRSDTGSNGWGAFNGMGFATDLVFNLNTGKHRSAVFENAFRITLENFGFIRWNENTLHHQTDSSYYYEGFEVENVLDENNSVFTGQSINDTIRISYEKKAITTLLPFTFTFSKTVDPASGAKVQGFYGVRMRAFCNYKPLFFAGIAFLPTSTLSVSPYVSFGGYGSFKAGLQADVQLKKILRLSLSSTNLVGDISKKGYGKDIALTLYSCF